MTRKKRKREVIEEHKRATDGRREEGRRREVEGGREGEGSERRGEQL